MTSSPNHWEAISLEDVGIPKATTINPSDFPNQRFELWSVPSFPSDEPEVLTGNEIGSSKQQVFPGDVLLCKINPRINRVWVVRDPQDGLTQIASSEWIVFRSDHWHSGFLRRRFEDKWFRDLICSNVSGVGGSLTRARPKDVKTYEITLPPLNEQRRIADKIDALQAKSRRAREALETVGPLLEKFRQSVLAAAFRGDLTAEWRKQHPDVEPAKKLLERIRAERRARWEEAELAKMQTKGIKPKNDKWKAKYTEPKPVDASDLPELPEGWCWASVEEILKSDQSLSYGVLKPGEADPNGVPMYRVMDIGHGEIFHDNVMMIRQELAQEYKRTELMEGDILLAVMATIGRTAVVTSDMNGANVNRALAVIKTSGLIDSTYLCFIIQSPFFQEAFATKKKGSAQARINLADLRKYPVPLPSEVEQNAIVNNVKKAVDRLQKAQSAVQEGLYKTLILDQSILAKAFRGELVPQDPNDEPALVLLERIKAEREASKGKKKTRRKA